MNLPCRNCDGLGELNNMLCLNCGGSGVLRREVRPRETPLKQREVAACVTDDPRLETAFILIRETIADQPDRAMQLLATELKAAALRNVIAAEKIATLLADET